MGQPFFFFFVRTALGDLFSPMADILKKLYERKAGGAPCNPKRGCLGQPYYRVALCGRLETTCWESWPGEGDSSRPREKGQVRRAAHTAHVTLVLSV